VIPFPDQVPPGEEATKLKGEAFWHTGFTLQMVASQIIKGKGLHADILMDCT